MEISDLMPQLPPRGRRAFADALLLLSDATLWGDHGAAARALVAALAERPTAEIDRCLGDLERATGLCLACGQYDAHASGDCDAPEEGVLTPDADEYEEPTLEFFEDVARDFDVLTVAEQQRALVEIDFGLMTTRSRVVYLAIMSLAPEHRGELVEHLWTRCPGSRPRPVHG